MVKVPTDDLEEMNAIGKKLSMKINSVLRGVMELEFEKVFKRFLPLTKKRYAAWYFEMNNGGWRDSIETKGIETVRRDWCELTSETVQKILEIILKKDDIKMAVEYFDGVVREVVKGKNSHAEIGHNKNNDQEG